jgi:Sec-independent protein translocase protein TatA
VGFGTEILFILLLGLLVYGPKQLLTLLNRVARARSQFENATCGFQSLLSAEFDAGSRESKTDHLQNQLDTRIVLHNVVLSDDASNSTRLCANGLTISETQLWCWTTYCSKGFKAARIPS